MRLLINRRSQLSPLYQALAVLSLRRKLTLPAEPHGKEALQESRQYFEVAAAQTSVLVNLVFSRQICLFECEHPFIDKLMVITEPAVASARLLGLGSTELYPNNLPASSACSTKILLDSCSLYWVRQNRASERKALLAGWHCGESCTTIPVKFIVCGSAENPCTACYT